MADQNGEKTEAPTPKRRQESREKGQVAKSQDLTAAVVTLSALLAIQWLGPSMWGKLLNLVQAGLSEHDSLSAGGLTATAGSFASVMIWMLVPIFIVVLIAALVTLYWQVGWLLTWHPVTPSFSKISPLQGFKRLFSPRTAVTTAINLGKMALMVAVVYWTVAGTIQQIIFASSLAAIDVYRLAASMVFDIGLRLAIVMLILALIDYTYQRQRHEKDLRMSKEEVREELKHMEGDPLMKRRRREVQMKLAMQRLQQDVPKSDVVITNPTHLSIALRYDSETMSAPKVIAKGADWMAFRIRQIAAANCVPIVERKELARMMYDAVEVGQEVPHRFYEAIAEVLAYVYELSGKNLGPRPVPLAS
ncbi:MAG: flagellar biosynthesis protein FlhB [Planctomycetes bacterium]|nr:flagellar biosynthesis protein FlhB [Planctomycetota bacterium]